MKKGIEFVLSLNATRFSSGIGKATEAMNVLSNKTKSLKHALTDISTTKLAIGGIVGGAVGIYANQVRQIADEYTNLNSRLKLVTDGEAELTAVRERLFQISQETGTEYAANADGYAKLARSVKNLGGDFQESLQITELVNKSLTVNGSSTEAAASFMLQFAQAMGKGKLDGDEFTAMLESNAYFANQLAKALETDMAGLLEMREAGELTANRLRTAFPKMAQAISIEFGKIAPTTGRAMTALDNVFKRIIDDANQASGGTGKVSNSILQLARTIDQNREGIINLFSFMIEMAAGATDKVVKLTSTVGNIGRSFSGWGAVFDGKLSFFEFATMDAKELNEWLIKNTKAVKETGGAAKAAGNEITAATKQAADAQKQVTGDALKEMEKMYKSYAKEVSRIQDELADHQRSAEEELREMKRSGMSDIAAWKDRKKEAGEFTQKAQEAATAARGLFTAGNVEAGLDTYKVAAEYADKAKSAYRDLNEEVKRGDQVVIGQQTALKVAISGVEEVNRIKSEILQEQSTALQLAQNALNEQSGGQLDKTVEQTTEKVKALGAAAEQAKAKVEEVLNFTPPEDGDWGKVWEVMESGSNKAAAGVSTEWSKTWDEWLVSGSENIDQLNKELNELTKDRHMKVFVEKVEKNRFGGLIGAYQTGGQVLPFATGGKLPGYGGGDRVKALLEPGEFVVRKEAVSKYGTAFLQALNGMRLKGLKQGGIAGAAASESINLNLTLPGGGQPIPMKIGPNEFHELQRLTRRMYARRSSNNGW